MISKIHGSSPSFGASFSYNGLRAGNDFYLATGESNKAVSSNIEQASDIANFLSWVQSDEAKEILDRLPKSDRVVYTVYYDRKNNAIRPHVYAMHHNKRFSDDLFDKSISAKDAFIQWVDNVAKYISDNIKCSEVETKLLTEFSVDVNNQQSDNGIFCKIV